MILKKDTILIVGAGNMGFAFISALLDNKISPKQINIIEKKPTLKLKKISKAKKINLFKSIDELNIKTKISITLIAIKPNQLDSLFTQDFNSKTKNSILISIVSIPCNITIIHLFASRTKSPISPFSITQFIRVIH